MRFVTPLLLLASVAAAHADCKDPQSNGEMKLCAEQEWKKADAELNHTYRQAIDAAREQYRSLRREPGYRNIPDSEAMLRQAQQSWVAFRDTNCNYHYQIYYGGSHAGLAYLLCKADMTKARVKEMKFFIDGEGDTSDQK